MMSRSIFVKECEKFTSIKTFKLRSLNLNNSFKKFIKLR